MSDDFENKPPITRSDLVRELTAIGVEAGQVLMLHASLSSLGNVIGGADAVVLALRQVVGEDGTLIALASWDNGPSDDDNGWAKEVREAYFRDPPAFDPQVSSCARYVGRLPERLRTWPGAIRSDHPEASFVALGGSAQWLTEDQPTDHPYGAGSPLAKVLEANGSILMLGAPLETITMLHHAEELADIPDKRSVHYSAPVKTPTGIEWREIHDINTSTGAFLYEPVVGDRDAFEVIAEEALAAGIGRERAIGDSRSFLFPAQVLVAFAVEWLEANFA
jgi:aminoglycoside 3-N-acetyltransferase